MANNPPSSNARVIELGNTDRRGTHGVAGSLAPTPAALVPLWEDALDTTLRVITAA